MKSAWTKRSQSAARRPIPPFSPLSPRHLSHTADPFEAPPPSSSSTSIARPRGRWRRRLQHPAPSPVSAPAQIYACFPDRRRLRPRGPSRYSAGRSVRSFRRVTGASSHRGGALVPDAVLMQKGVVMGEMCAELSGLMAGFVNCPRRWTRARHRWRLRAPRARVIC